MYSIIIESGFCALHRVQLPDGSWEPPHGHDWLVRVCVSRRELDERAMVVDFHDAQNALRTVLAELHMADLNASPALGGQSPTAETIARHVFERITRETLPGVRIRRVEVTEALGCTAVFEPDHPE